MNDIGGKHELTPPKTKKSIRIIGISETVASVFKAQKEYTDELKIALGKNYAHPEMVFPSLNSSVDLKLVSEYLGHCDVSVTADIYTDVLLKTKA